MGLYDLTKGLDPERRSRRSNPAKLKEMQELFMAEAAKHQVFPLDNSLAARMVAPRPSVTAGRTEFHLCRQAEHTDSIFKASWRYHLICSGGPGMLTIQDCIAMSELTEEELDTIAEQSHVPEIIAAELGCYLVRTADVASGLSR